MQFTEFSKFKAVGIRLPKQLYLLTKALAAQRQISMTKLIIRAIEAYVTNKND